MHHIFLIHGMGNSNTGWSENARKLITDQFDKSRYSFLDQAWPFKDHFKLHEINYNDIFDEYLDEAKKQAEKLGQWSKLAGGASANGIVGVLGRIVDLAKKPPNKNNFVVTHLADVALFMGTDVGELVRLRINQQIAKKLNDEDYDPGNDKWSVVAHSLGTRAMTEVLQVGFSDETLTPFRKARVVMMVSNTSRLLQDLSPFRAGDVYKNLVFPAKGKAGVCFHYINVTHRLDPFAFIKEFDPPADFGDGNAFVDEAYHPIKLNVTDITSKEIHSLEHYLEQPEVHTTLFNYLLPAGSKSGPKQSELDAAMKDHRNKTLSAGITNVWRESLTKLKDQPFQSVMEIFDLWEKYGALIK